ncbi:MAG: hypothetical protein HMLKMBBP_03329 [Planctomycetes bacterium]|nr:hypothetical protein [Planctomycetota bacterium]
MLLDTRKEPAAGAAGASRFAAKWLKDDPAAAAAAFPWTVRDASLAAPPGRGPNRLAEAKGSRHPWGFSLERSGRTGPAAWISLAAVLALLAAGFRALWLRGGAWRGVGAAAACWIGFHHALHSVWGAGETFLYAPHWVGAQSLLVGAAAVAWRPRSRAATAEVWLLAACAAAWNLRNIGLMLDALR